TLNLEVYAMNSDFTHPIAVVPDQVKRNLTLSQTQAQMYSATIDGKSLEPSNYIYFVKEVDESNNPVRDLLGSRRIRVVRPLVDLKIGISRGAQEDTVHVTAVGSVQ